VIIAGCQRAWHQRESSEALTRLPQLSAQRIKFALVRRRNDPYDHIHGRQQRKPFEAHKLTEPTLQSIACDGGLFIPRHHKAHAYRRRKGSDRAHVHRGGAHALPFEANPPEFVAAREPLAARERSPVAARIVARRGR
jgi:hypothetical protein